MNLYTMSYKRQVLEDGEWYDSHDSRYSLYTVASSEEDAKEKFTEALRKLNSHTLANTRYIPSGSIKKIEAISVSEGYNKTIVTGIWE